MWPEVVLAVRHGTGIDPLAYLRQFHDGVQRLNARYDDRALIRG